MTAKPLCMNKIADLQELAIVNGWYQKVQFKPTLSLEKEIVVLAKRDGKAVGAGRLVTLNEKNVELGGMFVVEEERKNKVARQIVQTLLEHTSAEKQVYCIPFGHLKHFYESFGFKEIPSQDAPLELLQRFDYCTHHQTQKMLLMKLER